MTTLEAVLGIIVALGPLIAFVMRVIVARVQKSDPLLAHAIETAAPLGAGKVVQLAKAHSAADRMKALVDAVNDPAMGEAFAELQEAISHGQKAQIARAPLVVLPVLMLVALFTASCGAPAEFLHVVQVSSEIIVEAEPCLVKEYEREQGECLALEEGKAKPCMEAIRAKWEPLIEALGELRDFRCGIEPAKCEAP